MFVLKLPGFGIQYIYIHINIVTWKTEDPKKKIPKKINPLNTLLSPWNKEQIRYTKNSYFFCNYYLLEYFV